MAQEPAQPNVLFIFADDLSYETLGCLGMTEAKTPNLDRLAESGVLFSQAYNMGSWTGAVCVASRTMLNTGAFVYRAQETLHKKPHWSEMMHDAGYTTYMTGKWHIGGKPRFDVVKNVRGGMPKQTKAGYNRPLSPEDYATGWKPWDKSQGGFWEGGTHWSEVLANDSIEFLKQAKQDDNPFFMYLAFNATHDPRQSPKEYIDMYPLDEISVPENFLTEYPYKDDIGNSAKLRDEQLAPFPRTEYAIKVHRQEYFAILSHMDDQIGRILDELEESGLADNTYIIFTADHGLAVGHHGLVGKQNMYDHSIRVPFIMVGPGIEAGAKNDAPIYLQDAMATALDLAGVEQPDYVEFQSLMPIIGGEAESKYQSIFGTYMNWQRMIKQGDMKLILYPFAKKKLRLYNVKKDPYEMNDLSDNPEYAELIARMKVSFKALQQAMGDSFDVDHPGDRWSAN
jgi:choline-sulfatase